MKKSPNPKLNRTKSPKHINPTIESLKTTYTHCSHCRKTISLYNAKQYGTLFKEYYCSECFKKLFTCKHCGSFLAIDDALLTVKVSKKIRKDFKAGKDIYND